MTITEFLLARIAEDEAVANSVTWGHPLGAPSLLTTYGTLHINPERVRAECAAKRRIVEAFEDERQRKDIYNRDYPLGLLTTEGDLRARHSSNARWAGLEIAARALAAVYADHPDYDEGWRP